MTNPYNSLLNNTLCNSFCKKIKFDSFFNNLPDYTNAILNHYYYKSFEQYCFKKKKGRADFNKKVIK